MNSYLQMSLLKNVSVILSCRIGHTETNHRNVISDGNETRVKIEVRQTGGPYHVGDGDFGLESDQGDVVTHGDVIGHRGQVPARVNHYVTDPVGRPPPGHVRQACVHGDMVGVEAVTAPGTAPPTLPGAHLRVPAVGAPVLVGVHTVGRGHQPLRAHQSRPAERRKMFSRRNKELNWTRILV